MKEIPVIQFSPQDSTVSLLKVALNFPTDQGLSIADIRARIRVLDVIEKCKIGDIIKLEDEDYKTAAEAIKRVRWTSTNKDVVRFGEQFGL